MVELDLAKRAEQYLQALHTVGFDLVAPEDYTLIEPMVRATGRATQTPMLSISRNDFTHGDAFWLFLTLSDGTIVGGCAARFYNLRGEEFESYLRRTSQSQYDRDRDPILSVAPPVARDIGGRLVYLGELEIHPEYRGRAKVLKSYFRMLQALAAMKWDFDWMYAFVPNDHVKLTDVYGFTWKMPRAITWREPVPQGRRNDHWMVAISRRHFDHVWSCADYKSLECTRV